jgi:hypothetical protein
MLRANAPSSVKINIPRLSLSNLPHTLNLDGFFVARFKSSIGIPSIARIHAFRGSTHVHAAISPSLGRLLTKPGGLCTTNVNLDSNHASASLEISILAVVGEHLNPCSRTLTPSTNTNPSAINRSASRLEHVPRLARILLTRSSSPSPTSAPYPLDVNPRPAARSYGFESNRSSRLRSAPNPRSGRLCGVGLRSRIPSSPSCGGCRCCRRPRRASSSPFDPKSRRDDDDEDDTTLAAPLVRRNRFVGARRHRATLDAEHNMCARVEE